MQILFGLFGSTQKRSINLQHFHACFFIAAKWLSLDLDKLWVACIYGHHLFIYVKTRSTLAQINFQA